MSLRHPSLPALAAVLTATAAFGPCRRAVRTDRCDFAVVVRGDDDLTAWDETLGRYFHGLKPGDSEQRAFGERVRSACNRLPPALRGLVNKHLATVAVVDGDPSPSGLSAVSELDGRDSRGLIIFNAASYRGFDDSGVWLSAKEASLFGPGPNKVEIRLGEAHDGLVDALNYTLLHELGHTLSYAYDWLPADWEKHDAAESFARYPFYRDCWLVAGGAFVSRWDKELPERPSFKFYGVKPTMPNARLPGVYATLATTKLVDLYAGVRPIEEAAELFANYAHTVVLGRPFHTVVTTPTGRQEYDSCLVTGACPERRAFLERWQAELTSARSP